jgi:hypothetical protein
MSALRINYVAVVVAAIVVFAIGFFWYSPLLFQVAWIQAHGYTQDQLDGMKTSMGRTYGLSFICILVMGVVLSILLGRTGTSTARGGATLGALVWLGFAATIGFMASLYTGAPVALYLIDAGYQLVYLIAMGAILGWTRSRAA